LYDLPRTLFSFLPHTDSSLFWLTGFFLRVYVSGTFEEAFRRCSWIHVWSAVHHLFFLTSYRFWPFQTDRLFYCVGMCQEQLKRRWGNTYFNQCIISRAQSNFCWSHSDSCLFGPTIFVLACVCVRSTWRGVEAMPIWIHLWSDTHDPFLCYRIQTPAFADQPFLFLRVNVSRAGEEPFRRCLFEYMSQSNFFGPHTDSCLVGQNILFPVCMCHGQLCQEYLKRRSGDAYLNTTSTSMIRRVQSFFFGLIQTLAFSDRPFI